MGKKYTYDRAAEEESGNNGSNGISGVHEADKIRILFLSNG